MAAVPMEEEARTSEDEEDDVEEGDRRLPAEKLKKTFKLPINEAAEVLHICPTVLKKICRRRGIPRWPHRKVKCLERMIADCEARVAANPGDQGSKLELDSLREKLDYLLDHPQMMNTLSIFSGKDWNRSASAAGNAAKRSAPSGGAVAAGSAESCCIPPAGKRSKKHRAEKIAVVADVQPSSALAASISAAAKEGVALHQLLRAIEGVAPEEAARIVRKRVCCQAMPIFVLAPSTPTTKCADDDLAQTPLAFLSSVAVQQGELDGLSMLELAAKQLCSPERMMQLVSSPPAKLAPLVLPPGFE